jgi:ABC-type transport system substrate-binding protein
MGMKATVVERDFASIINDAYAGNFSAFCFTWEISVINPPTFLYDLFHSSWIYFSSPLFRFSNATIDAVLDNMMAAKTLEEAKLYAREATALLAYEQPMVVCYNDALINVWRNDKFTGFMEFAGKGATGGNPYSGTKIRELDGTMGGSLKYRMSRDLETTNVLMASEKPTIMVYGYIYELLWQIDPHTWDPIPGLAYDWQIEETVENQSAGIQTGQKYTFYLYENATWHDGSPVTAEDVRFSLMELWPTSPQAPSEIQRGDIYQVDAVTEKEVAIYVNQTGYFEWASTTQVPILPKQIWEPKGPDYAQAVVTDEEMIGSGPYFWDTHVEGEYIMVYRYNDWRWNIQEILASSRTSTTTITTTTTTTTSWTTSTTGINQNGIPLLGSIDLVQFVGLNIIALVIGVSMAFLYEKLKAR